jgi:putative Ca2+/H+ antiporter (TMEM165/GDT1 family)
MVRPKHVSNPISATVTYTGAVLFIIFGFVYLYEASHPEAAQLL